MSIEGAQTGCRLSFAIKAGWTGGSKGKPVKGPTGTVIEAGGTGESSLRAPNEPGRYRLITWVDNFLGQTGCTPTTSIQRIRVS